MPNPVNNNQGGSQTNSIWFNQSAASSNSSSRAISSGSASSGFTPSRIQNTSKAWSTYNILGGGISGSPEINPREQAILHAQLRLKNSSSPLSDQGEEQENHQPFLESPESSKPLLKEIIDQGKEITRKPIIRKGVPFLGEATGAFEDPLSISIPESLLFLGFTEGEYRVAPWNFDKFFRGIFLYEGTFGGYGLSITGDRQFTAMEKGESLEEANLRYLQAIQEGFCTTLYSSSSGSDFSQALYTMANTPVIPERPQGFTEIYQGIGFSNGGDSFDNSGKFFIGLQWNHLAGFRSAFDPTKDLMITEPVMWNGEVLWPDYLYPVAMERKLGWVRVSGNYGLFFREDAVISAGISGENTHLTPDVKDPITGEKKRTFNIIEGGIQVSPR